VFKPIRSRWVMSMATLSWGIHFSPLSWAFGGGDGIRTHGLYIANV
jgi:hypothetical protein